MHRRDFFLEIVTFNYANVLFLGGEHDSKIMGNLTKDLSVDLQFGKV